MGKLKRDYFLISIKNQSSRLRRFFFTFSIILLVMASLLCIKEGFYYIVFACFSESSNYPNDDCIPTRIVIREVFLIILKYFSAYMVCNILFYYKKERSERKYQ